MTLNNYFWKKGSKNAEFHYDVKSIEKVKKAPTFFFLQQTSLMKMSKSEKSAISVTSFLITFFGAFVSYFFH
jgi:hypothetical protein